jgi:hypothetical protein
MFKTKFSSSGGRFDSEMSIEKILRGEDGFSPIVEVEEIENGHRVILTDKNGSK